MPSPETIPETDMSLLHRFADRGDEDAFSEIVRRYAGVVYCACHRVLRDRGWAEDVAQETFFRLLKSRESVSQSLGGWLTLSRLLSSRKNVSCATSSARARSPSTRLQTEDRKSVV